MDRWTSTVEVHVRMDEIFLRILFIFLIYDTEEKLRNCRKSRLIRRYGDYFIGHTIFSSWIYKLIKKYNQKLRTLHVIIFRLIYNISISLIQFITSINDIFINYNTCIIFIFLEIYCFSYLKRRSSTRSFHSTKYRYSSCLFRSFIPLHFKALTKTISLSSLLPKRFNSSMPRIRVKIKETRVTRFRYLTHSHIYKMN